MAGERYGCGRTPSSAAWRRHGFLRRAELHKRGSSAERNAPTSLRCSLMPAVSEASTFEIGKIDSVSAVLSSSRNSATGIRHAQSPGPDQATRISLLDIVY
jgi:hypothetical protein